MNGAEKWLKEPVKIAAIFGTWFRILVFISGLVASYASLKLTLDAWGKKLDTVSAQTTHIERYLSSKDPQYWETVKRLGD